MFCRATNVGDFFIATYSYLLILTFSQKNFRSIDNTVFLWSCEILTFSNSNLVLFEIILHIFILNVILFLDDGTCL